MFALCVGISACTQEPSTGSVAEQEIWNLEDAYWQYAAAGDVDSYLALWHEDFVGWFCGADNPFRKVDIGKWVQAIRDEGQVLFYELDNKTSQVFDNLVVVYYTTPVEIVSPEGGHLWAGEVFKVTHTWMKVDDQWQIIGGMCGQLSAPPAAAGQTMTRVPVFQTETTGGNEAHMWVAEIGPDAETGFHEHPTPRFVYVIEGAVVLEIDGQPDRTFAAGEGFQERPGVVHNFRNASATQSARAMGFQIAAPGQTLQEQLTDALAEPQ